jgi:hypothetical protein
MAISSQGTTFTFAGFSAHFTSISVEDPQAEVVDMTSQVDPVGQRHMVGTGDITSPGRIRLDYIRLTGTPAPLEATGLSGNLSISHANVSIQKLAVLESASSEMAVGDVIRGSVNFVISDLP